MKFRETDKNWLMAELVYLLGLNGKHRNCVGHIHRGGQEQVVTCVGKSILIQDLKDA